MPLKRMSIYLERLSSRAASSLPSCTSELVLRELARFLQTVQIRIRKGVSAGVVNPHQLRPISPPSGVQNPASASCRYRACSIQEDKSYVVYSHHKSKRKESREMVYVTVRQSPRYHQISLEELLFGEYKKPVNRKRITGTRTYRYDGPVGEKFARSVDPVKLVQILQKFNESTEALRRKKRRSLYYSFPIPKRDGGVRQIDAPRNELKASQYVLKAILEEHFGALYHTAAYAYAKGRCTVDAVKQHQANESKWFGKYDLHNFFGSTTKEFMMSQLSMVFPFSEIVVYPAGREALEQALDLAFLDGVLPQGTPLSPTLTNLMMIPVDYELSRKLRSQKRNEFVYTRYADDFIISSRKDFDPKEVERIIVETLQGFSAPFTINSKKTRYGSSAGSNWNLGVMLNKDNQITIGFKRKRQFSAMLHSYASDRLNGVKWPVEDVQSMYGHFSYYRMVEREAMDSMVKQLNEKLNTDVIALIKSDIY